MKPIASALALASALLLAACGGSASPAAPASLPAEPASPAGPTASPASSPKAPAPSGAASPAVSGAPINVKIAYAAPSASFWALYVSKEAGYYTRYGLNATLTQMGGTLMVPAALNGEVDVLDLAAGGLVPAVLAGADLKLIASDSNATVYGFVVNKDIQKPADLAGKSLVIAGRGQSDDYLVRRILNMNHLQADKDVALIPSGGTPESLAVLDAGKAVGAMLSPPTLFHALDSGFHLLLRPADLFPYQGSGLIMKTSKLNTPAGQEIARRLVHAHLDALHRIKSDKAFATEVLAKYIKGTTPDIANRTYDWVVPAMPADGRPTKDGLQLVVEDMKDLYKGKQAPSIDSLIDPRFLDQAG